MKKEELIKMLVEAEWDDRLNRNIESRLRNAKFRYQSCMVSIDCQANRNLDRIVHDAQRLSLRVSP